MATSSSPNAKGVKLENLLVLNPVTPLSLLDDLRKQWTNVIYAPKKQFSPPRPDDVLPTDEQLAQADAILAFQLPDGLISVQQVPRLKYVQALSAGYTQFEHHEFYKSLTNKDNITFASASGIHVSTIGEHSIATAMMLLHKLHLITYRLRNERKWMSANDEYGLFIRELRDLTVGIAGYGHIGRETARMAAGMGSRIIALNRSGKPSPETGYIVKGTGDPSGSLPEQYFSTEDKSSVLEFCARADIIVNTLPESESTRYFFGKPQFEAMKGDAILINIGRGTTVDQEALVKALQAQRSEEEPEDATGTLRIGGTSLDVTDPEPLPEGHPLFSLENVIVTPHMSGMSRDYFKRATDLLNVNADRLRSGRGALNAFRGKGEHD
ncbi:hypothetical protein OIV83_002015 [Microbotryomycetes sp. JL201]|nr:hypothetical protein OIV83_002015 [Microbotryomycetes sp. JL201]